jgi:hypothetical protein
MSCWKFSYDEQTYTYLALKIEAVKVGLKINKQKTKYMIAAWNETIRDVETFAVEPLFTPDKIHQSRSDSPNPTLWQ